MQNKNYRDAFENCCCKFMAQVFSSKFVFTLPYMSCCSLSNIYKVLSCSNRELFLMVAVQEEMNKPLRKNNCKMLEVIYKTCCILYSSIKYLFPWEFLVCFYKILPVGSIRWFWSSTEWLESDGRNFWLLMIQFFLLVSMLSFRELPVWALSWSDTN